MAHLTLHRGDHLLWTHPLKRGRVRIGRDPQAEIVLPDAEVSRIHALIEGIGLGHRLVDNSRNGTRVNGVAEKVARLRHGDEVHIGPFSLTYSAARPGDLTEPPSTIVASGRAAVTYSARSHALVASQEVLLVQDRGQPPFVYTPRGSVQVGRGLQNDLILPGAGDARCALVPTDEGYLVEASPGSIRLNGAPCSGGILTPGDRLQVGGAVLELRQESLEESLEGGPSSQIPGMIGASEAMARVTTLIHRVAPLDAPTIVIGETGTGKELVARALHDASPRRDAPFIALNCGAISPELAESELFGHVKGAFTGAATQRRGAFREASGGTLFLDEVGELPPTLQVKLLRVLETGALTPVGASREVAVDCRIVAATHRDLLQEVEAKRFRQDLFFRLFVIPIQLPPLRERGGDLPLLIAHFLGELGATGRLTPEAEAALIAHPWPGNVRELRHVLTRAIATCPQARIGSADLLLLPPTPGAPAPSVLPSLQRIEDMERALIARTLAETQSQREAAESLGIARSTLHLKIRKYRLDAGT